MLRIVRYLSKAEIGQMLVALVSIVGQIWLDLTLPDYMADITQLVETPGSEMHDIWVAGGKMLLVSLGSAACAVVTGFIAARVGASFSQRLRSLEFNKVESFGPAEMNRFSTASLITRSTNDITQIQMFITMGLMMIVKAPIMAVWAVCKIAGKGFDWTLATGIAVAILLVVIAVIMSFVMPKFKAMQRLTDNINLVARENLTGLRVVRAYNAEDYQEAKFTEANKELTETQLFTNRAMAIMMPLMNTIMNGLMLAVYWIGAYLIDAADAVDKLKGDKAVEALKELIVSDAKDQYSDFEDKLGSEGLRQLERRVVLAVLDRKWREHLYEMDYLKDGIGLRGMGQRDPLVEYQREGYQMYNSMIEAIKEETIQLLFHVDIERVAMTEDEETESDEDEAVNAAEAVMGLDGEAAATGESAPAEPETDDEAEKTTIDELADEQKNEKGIVGMQPISHAEGKVPANKRPKSEELHSPWADGRTFPGTGKNAQCPCGSGRKYKMCHGQNEQ